MELRREKLVRGAEEETAGCRSLELTRRQLVEEAEVPPQQRVREAEARAAGWRCGGAEPGSCRKSWGQEQRVGGAVVEGQSTCSRREKPYDGESEQPFGISELG